MTQIMLSYPVTLKALKITCYVKHIKCPATPQTSPNTYSAIHNFLLFLSSHHISTSPCLYCDSNLSEFEALSICCSCPYFCSSSIDHGTLQSQALHYPSWHLKNFADSTVLLPALQTSLPLSSCSGNGENSCFFQKF